MSRPIFELDNSLNWNLARRGSFQARVDPRKKGKFKPIPPISIPINSYLVVVGTKSKKAKPNWWLGVYVSVRLLVSVSSTTNFILGMEVYRHRCGLNTLTLLELPRLHPLPFLLILTPPHWHQQLDLEVWSYDGVDSDTTTESLVRIEEKIDLCLGEEAEPVKDITPYLSASSLNPKSPPHPRGFVINFESPKNDINRVTRQVKQTGVTNKTLTVFGLYLDKSRLRKSSYTYPDNYRAMTVLERNRNGLYYASNLNYIDGTLRLV
ncbi:MAG: hypothetical protein F6J89_02145 [Symploca sp. SIO1C4]|uniref:Uncharacterized protein n=1 Tax=Symploca sp. SIO1C4 TaxID=2607765 RepID=A0A6B3N745_9CYAN|nr:hypothetical protein [Symploca sp. SIO1C4]